MCVLEQLTVFVILSQTHVSTSLNKLATSCKQTVKPLTAKLKKLSKITFIIKQKANKNIQQKLGLEHVTETSDLSIFKIKIKQAMEVSPYKVMTYFNDFINVNHYIGNPYF